MRYMGATTHRWMNTWLLAIFVFMSMLGTSIAIQNSHDITDCETNLYNKLVESRDVTKDLGMQQKQDIRIGVKRIKN